MAHLDQMLANIDGHELRERVRQQMSKSLPKLGFAEVPAYIIDIANETFSTNELLSWVRDGKKDNQAPITCRIINLSKFYAGQGMSHEAIEEAARTALMELYAQSCDAILYNHEYPEGNTIKKELCLGIPCTQLAMEDGKTTVFRDINGAGKWIAYLLDKEYANEEEVEATFNASFLTESKSYRTTGRTL